MQDSAGGIIAARCGGIIVGEEWYDGLIVTRFASHGHSSSLTEKLPYIAVSEQRLL